MQYNITIKRSFMHHPSYPEICQDILPLHIFSSQPNLLECMILIPLKISQGDLKHSMFKSFRSNLSFERTSLNKHTKFISPNHTP